MGHKTSKAKANFTLKLSLFSKKKVTFDNLNETKRNTFGKIKK